MKFLGSSKEGKREELEMRCLQLTNSKFARLVGTSRAQLDRIIKGDVNSMIVRLKEICDVTEINLGELVTL